MSPLLAAVLLQIGDLPENEWVRVSPREGKPIPRFAYEGSGAYDPARRLWIHQGGHDGIPQGFALFTCEIDTGLWRQRFPNTSPPGACCVDGANVFDPANDRFVRFPGASLGHGWQWSRKVKLKSSPVWLYDPGAGRWTAMRPPPYRAPEKYAKTELGALNAGGTYDPNHEVALSFGGQTSGGGTNNLWVYDAYANLLERLEAADPPPPRDGHGICYDAKNDCLVVFGSQYAGDEQTWIYRYRTNRWEPLALDPHPPAKKQKTYSTIPKMAYDPLHGICLCVTWDDATGRHQTWALDVSARKWTRMNPSREPEPSLSRSRNLGFSAEHNAFLLELVAQDRGPELWAYRYRKAPPPRATPRDVQVVTAPGRATVTWSPVAGASTYQVYRAAASKAWETDYTKVAEVRETKFEDPSVEAGRIYFYRVSADGGPPSFSARTQPRVLLRPIVSVLAADRVEVAWDAHPASDVVGYNIYRGVAGVAAVKKGEPGPWRDNDPEYAEPRVVSVRDITNLARLNAELVAATSFTDTGVDLSKKGPESGDYRWAVYAYVVRAVNRLGVESGPSPYALTIPSEPEHVFLREVDGGAELKWNAAREKGVSGYHVYEVTERQVARITAEPVRGTAYRHAAGKGTKRYCVVAVDALGQEGQPSSPVWYNHRYAGFFDGEWHQ
jgi:hypothetical protein